MSDALANFAYSTVATAPSPATTGTSLVVAAGQGSRFPTVPFNAVIWPIGAIPTPANAEVVRVTNRSTDTLTITRTQESSSARSVVVGDQIAAAITAKTLTDITAAVSADIVFVSNLAIRRNTADASDSGGVEINGGGGSGETRGGNINVYGNEHGSYPGFIRVRIGGGTGSQLLIERPDAVAAIVVLASDGAAIFSPGGVETIRFPAAGGVKFPATQIASTDAHALDDYEEDVWTPAIAFGGGTTGITYGARAGWYIKIGKMVFFGGTLALTSKGSSVGNATLTGLPFPSENTANHNAGMHVTRPLNFTGATEVTGGIAANSSQVSLYTSGTVIADTHFQNTSLFDYFFGHYKASA